MSAVTLVDPPLAEQVQGILKSNPHLSPTRLSIRADEGRVELDGQVDSFYQKQMAQELIRRLDGVERIENRLKVCWPKS